MGFRLPCLIAVAFAVSACGPEEVSDRSVLWKLRLDGRLDDELGAGTLGASRFDRRVNLWLDGDDGRHAEVGLRPTAGACRRQPGRR